MLTTRIVAPDAAAIDEAARLIRAGRVVGFPTETVYGLGANGLNAEAVAAIFAAKERPADNPLILHVASAGDIAPLVRGIDGRAARLMDAFWPGPLTLVLPRSGVVPSIVTAGLDTVAVRMPAHPVALALIRAAGCPIAAPSANRSGRPSPTTAAAVLADMDGRIALILDGGPCAVGVESAVLSLAGPVPRLLRPGGVTLEQLRALLGEVEAAPSLLQPLAAGEQPQSPGMAHRHYAPRIDLTVVRGGEAVLFARYDDAVARGLRPVLLCTAEAAEHADGRRCVIVGRRDRLETVAEGLFEGLRALDAQQADVAFAEALPTGGLGLAIMNRLLRAAQFQLWEGE